MIVWYEIHNTSGSRIENLYAGVAIDWGGECDPDRGLYGL